MKAVILAGGKGARLAPYTRVIPKPLMPIGDMPILEVLLRQIKRAGVDDVILTVGHMAELLQAFFQNGERLALPVRYSYEDKPLGTAGPLRQISGLDEAFLVMNGDVLTTLDFNELVECHRRSGAMVTVAVHPRDVKIDLGVLRLDGDSRVVDYIEKPTYNFVVSMGVYVFNPRVLEYIPKGQYFDFPDLILKLLAANEVVKVFRFEGYWMDLGRPDDYDQAVSDFERMRAEFLPEGD